MTLPDLQSRQAEEHSKMEEDIIKNVAAREWTKDQLRTSMAYLYIIGLRHGHEIAALSRKNYLENGGE